MFRATLLATAALFASGCTTMDSAQEAPVERSAMVSPILTTPDAVDDQTYAQPQVARVTHVALDLDLDFDAKMIGGGAVLDILAKDDAKQIVLDSNGLRIDRVTDGQGNSLPFTIGESEEGKGAPLTIQLNGARQLRIAYRSAPDADALQWLTPEQTAGGKYPYLFSQGQAILNRTWIPTQDSPGIRQTWEARITAPKPLDVVMSGVRQGEPEDLGNGRRAFRFVMDKPVPPYLIAIAAGDIDFRATGPRTGVWAEPATLDRAYDEVADTEQLVEAAEELYGDYRWGRYDMIVLPPSFPYGGMENPVMTFLTPTFIAGDRSNNGLVAHELAHSWSGNLVTNAVWGDGWLNEGVTSYFENRIVEKVYGKSRAEQEAALSYANIIETLDEVGYDAPGTALHNEGDGELIGSAIAYDKGHFFLRTVERAVRRMATPVVRQPRVPASDQPDDLRRHAGEPRHLARRSEAVEAARMDLRARPAEQCRQARSCCLRHGRYGGDRLCRQRHHPHRLERLDRCRADALPRQYSQGADCRAACRAQ